MKQVLAKSFLTAALRRLIFIEVDGSFLPVRVQLSCCIAHEAVSSREARYPPMQPGAEKDLLDKHFLLTLPDMLSKLGTVQAFEFTLDLLKGASFAKQTTLRCFVCRRTPDGVETDNVWV